MQNSTILLILLLYTLAITSSTDTPLTHPTQFIIIMPSIQQQPLKRLFRTTQRGPCETRQTLGIGVAERGLVAESLDEGEVVVYG